MDVDELLDALDSFDDIPNIKTNSSASTPKTQVAHDHSTLFNSFPNKSHSNTKQYPYKLKNSSSESLDIDKLLLELDPTNQKPLASQKSLATSLRKNPILTRKCPSLFFGPGQCSNIRCVKCDFKCLMFENKEWKDVDYLFFRNFMPNVVDLEKRLKDSKNSISTCCQCSWITVTRRTSINDTELKWVCSGHS